MAEHPPVFVRPVSRSGGTLVTTILGVHSKLAMSYEIYEEDMRTVEGEVISAPQLRELLLTAFHATGPGGSGSQVVNAVPRSRIRSFLARAHRGNTDPGTVLSELESFLAAGGTFATLDGRLDFIDALMCAKARQDGKPMWGGKAKIDLNVLGSRHPRACVLMMVRDGRDILASRSRVGNFDTDPERVASEWLHALDEFETFATRHEGPTMQIRYETLVADPSSMLRQVCRTIGIDYEPAMANYEKLQLTLLDNPYGHLSANRIKEGLNADTIGRWHRDLAPDALDRFEAVAGHRLRDFDYATPHAIRSPQDEAARDGEG